MTRETAQLKFKEKITNNFFFKIFLLQKLPIALLAGIRIRNADADSCSVSVPFKWLSQNPFRSVYFATQAMAAEMSTGILSMLAIQGCDLPLSMLVTHVEATFLKKANTRIIFTCAGGKEIFDAVEKAIATNEGIIVRVKSEGRTADNTLISEFYITWSFKTKTKKQ